jgi:hypothetical protein
MRPHPPTHPSAHPLPAHKPPPLPHLPQAGRRHRLRRELRKHLGHRPTQLLLNHCSQPNIRPARLHAGVRRESGKSVAWWCSWGEPSAFKSSQQAKLPWAAVECGEAAGQRSSTEACTHFRATLLAGSSPAATVPKSRQSGGTGGNPETQRCTERRGANPVYSSLGWRDASGRAVAMESRTAHVNGSREQAPPFLGARNLLQEQVRVRLAEKLPARPSESRRAGKRAGSMGGLARQHEPRLALTCVRDTGGE